MNTAAAIEALHDRGRGQLEKSFSVPLKAFEPYAQRALAASASPESLHAEDLYLACACSLGISAAIEHFEATTAPVLSAIASRAQRAGVARDDFLQLLRVRLFVGGPGRPAIESYRGTGPLGGWVRVVATRVASELIARDIKPQHSAPNEATWSGLAGGDDVELSAMRSELRESFQEAFAAANARLTPQDRALLRQYYVHRVGVDGIAKLLGVHRSNASRAVARARGNFLRELKQLAGARLGLSDASLDSAFGLLRSDFKLNLASVLRAGETSKNFK